MPQKRTGLLPVVLLGILAIVFLAAVIVGWNIIFPLHYGMALGSSSTEAKVGYWVLMALGDVLLATVLVALGFFLSFVVRRAREQRRQDLFIDTVTHELRTPLTSMRLCLDTLERRELHPEKKAEFLHRMREDLDRLRDFIDHVIEVGRLEHGERRIDAVEVDLTELSRRCVARIGSRHELADDWCAIDAPEKLTLRSDPVAVETILLNLLENAVKYSDGPPQVRVRMLRDGDQLRIAVSDSGLGIPAQQHARIFTRFARLRAGGGGAGLGLYLVREICRLLGGSVHAQSKGPGQGSTFTVELPAHRRDSA